jgi:phage FluMu protein Com
MEYASKKEEARCHCGHLVAKLRRTGVELKCKRCKRLLLIPFERESTQLISKLASPSSAITGGE